jgi:hypothetical protein
MREKGIHTLVSALLRLIVYSSMIAGVYAVIRFDAVHPMGNGYFSELSLTEILQEVILFILCLFYLFLGIKNKNIQPLANLISLFFLISLIREFNFLLEWWFYPVFLILIIMAWFFYRDFKKLNNASVLFLRQPASAWLMAGFIITYIFSRLFGQSDFWLLLYDENSYRLAKAAVEEGLELLGNVIMLISAIEFTLLQITDSNNKIKSV